MHKLVVGSLMVLAFAAVTGPVQARSHHKHAVPTYGSDGYIEHGPRPARIHYGGKPGVGYWRRGPERGYGFGFSSYKGDPFGADDYYDGSRCYYVHKTDFCVKNRIFNGFD